MIEVGPRVGAAVAFPPLADLEREGGVVDNGEWILDLMRETSPEALSHALTILKEQNISPTYDTLRFFLHQTMEQKVKPFAFCGRFEVTQPDLVAFDQLMVG